MAASHPKNARGDFYVEDGCCTACGVPQFNAPELFAEDANNQCYVQRQPATPDELNRILRAVWESELGCIRYRGLDEGVLRRLTDMGAGDLSDTPILARNLIVRDHVTFGIDEPVGAAASAVARRFQAYLHTVPRHVPYRLRDLTSEGDVTQVWFAWYQDDFHAVDFARTADATRYLARTHKNMGVSGIVHDWLTAESAEHVAWTDGAHAGSQTHARKVPW